MLLAVMTIVVIITIAIAVMLTAYLVQNYAENISTRVHELVLHISRHLYLNFTAVDEQNQATMLPNTKESVTGSTGGVSMST